MGNFQNGKSRELSQVDGLSWKTSPTSNRRRSGYYWLDWRSYVLGAGYCYDYRQRSSELAVHC